MFFINIFGTITYFMYADTLSHVSSEAVGGLLRDTLTVIVGHVKFRDKFKSFFATWQSVKATLNYIR